MSFPSWPRRSPSGPTGRKDSSDLFPRPRSHHGLVGLERSLRQGLRTLGFIESQNIRIEWRFTPNGYDGLSDLAAELVQLNPDVIVTVTTPEAQAAKAATTTIPIVMSGVARPVEQGLVASMARPGGNATGTTNSMEGLGQKQLQLLKEAAPG